MSRSRSQMDRRVSHIALEIFDADIRERADEMATRERIVLRLDIRARCQELLDMVCHQIFFSSLSFYSMRSSISFHYSSDDYMEL